MEPLTATVIATLAFTKVVEKTAENLTQATLDKINQLRSKIWHQFRGDEEAQTAITEAEKGSEAALDRVTEYLKVAMDTSEQFSKEVQTLASEIQQEINIGKIQGQNVQNVYGGEAQQNNVVNPNGPVFQGLKDSTINFT